jgi:ADP-heptose:LPS heptosyltransferase
MPSDHTLTRILVIKHGALGDIVQALDSFASLRAGNPDAHIALMTTPGFVSFAAMMPWFDEVIADPRAGIFNLAASWRIRRVLRQDWSIMVDMQCSGRTKRYFTHFVMPATRWIGTAPGCSDRLPDFTGVNNRDRMMKTAEIAGGIAKNADMDWLMGDAASAGTPLLFTPSFADCEFPHAGRYAVLVPGCSLAKPQKRWPAERFAELANALLARNLTVLLVGTDDDRTAVDAVLAVAADAVDLCGKTNLVTLAQLLRGAAFVIGNDTGPMFLAAKTGAPSLMLMGPDTDPSMSAPTGRTATWLQASPIAHITAKAALDALEKLGLEPAA